MTVTNNHEPGSDQVVPANLTKTFGAVRAVRGIDLILERGSNVALLGPNGAGKTTTLDMVVGLNKPDAGSVSLFGNSPIAAVSLGLISFAVLDVAMGHLLTPDSLRPVLGGVTSLLALLEGAYSPLVTSGFLFTLIKLLPSYWLVQAGRTAVGGGWPLEGSLVVAGWSIALSIGAVRVCRRDTRRIQRES